MTITISIMKCIYIYTLEIIYIYYYSNTLVLSWIRICQFQPRGHHAHYQHSTAVFHARAAPGTWTPCFAAQSAPSISCYREVGPHNHSFLESANRGRSTVNALSSFLRDGHQWAKVWLTRFLMTKGLLWSSFDIPMASLWLMTSLMLFLNTKAPAWLRSHTRPRSCRALSEQLLQNYVVRCEDSAPTPQPH